MKCLRLRNNRYVTQSTQTGIHRVVTDLRLTLSMTHDKYIHLCTAKVESGEQCPSGLQYITEFIHEITDLLIL
jgi:hypothetical protein